MSKTISALPLFSGRDTYHIAASCCMGLIPCRIFADSATNPTAAVISLERFGIAFAAGDARHAESLLAALKGWHPWYEVNDPPPAWEPYLAAWSAQSHATVRYAFAHNTSFDTAALQKLATPPEGCQIVPYTHALLEQALTSQWSEDQMGTYTDIDSFLAEGFGLCVVKDGKIISGCASFCRHPDGYEIQVDTHPDFRGKGLAKAVSAAFILALNARGLMPYWDAANVKSMRLAEKLGFVFSRAFVGWILVASHADADAVDQQVVG